MPRQLNTQDSRLQRLAMIGQLIGKDDQGPSMGGGGEQPNMMDMMSKLYGINQEQALLPYKENDLAASAADSTARGNYEDANAASLPTKAEASRERALDHLTTALGMTQYLKGIGLNIDPQGMLKAVQTGDFSSVMSTGTPQPPGNYAALSPGMPGAQAPGLPATQPGGGVLGQLMAQAAFNNRGGPPSPIPQQPNNFVTAFQRQANQQTTY